MIINTMACPKEENLTHEEKSKVVETTIDILEKTEEILKKYILKSRKSNEAGQKVPTSHHIVCFSP